MTVLVLGPQAWWFKKEDIESATSSRTALINVSHKDFPDGETYVRIPVEERELQGEDVLVVHSLAPPQDKSLWQLLLILDALSSLRVRRVVAFIPYMAYARQDRAFLRGEPVSIRVLLRAIALQGARALFTIDIHNPQSLSEFGGYAENILMYDLLKSAIVLEGVENAIVIAPDRGAVQRAEALAKALGTSFDYLEKTRDRVTGEISLKPKSLSVRGKSVIVVDDVISTGGTIARATQYLLEQGANEVLVVASHAVMVGDAKEKIYSAGARAIYALDTLPPKEGVKYVGCIKGAISKIKATGIIDL